MPRSLRFLQGAGAVNRHILRLFLFVVLRDAIGSEAILTETATFPGSHIKEGGTEITVRSRQD